MVQLTRKGPRLHTIEVIRRGLTTFFIATASAAGATLMSIDELCKVDSYCKRILDTDGKVISVAPAIRKFIEQSRDVFIDTAGRYEVDPRAVAAAIAAENTMNVQASDLVQNWLAHRGITGVGNKKFTFGLGQINLDAAIEAESVMAEIDGRPQRSTKEVTEQLLTLDGAVYYATGIVKKAQNDYKERGFDISEKPEILATLYNLGQSKTRAMASANQKKSPQVNYFGYFVAKNLDDVSDLLGWDAANKKRTKPRVSEALVESQGVYQAKSPGVGLLTSPSTCSADGRAEAGRFNAVMTRVDFPQAVKAIGAFKVIGRGVNCELRDYVYAEFESGLKGWLPASQLTDTESGITPLQRTFQSRCQSAQAQKCLDEVKRTLGDGAVTGQQFKIESNNSLKLYLPTRTGKPLTESYLTSSNVNCADRASGSGGSWGGSTSAPLSAADYKKFYDKIKEIRSIVMERTGIQRWDDYSNNPFINDVGPNYGLEECLKSSTGCDVTVQYQTGVPGGGSRISNGPNALNEFLNYNPAQKDTRDLILDMKGYYMYINVRNSSAQVPQSPDQAIRDFNYKAAALQVQCKEFDKDKSLDEVRKEISRIGSAITPDNLPTIKSYIDQTMSAIDALSKSCTNVDRLAKGDVEGFESTMMPMSSGGKTAYLPARAIAKINPGRESLAQGMKAYIDDWSKTNLSNLKYTVMMPNTAFGDTQAICEYDPFKAAGIVQKLASLNCVSQVAVPDRFIMRSMQGPLAAKVLYDESDDKGFSIQLGGCEVPSRSWLDSVRGIQ